MFKYFITILVFFGLNTLKADTLPVLPAVNLDSISFYRKSKSIRFNEDGTGATMNDEVFLFVYRQNSCMSSTKYCRTIFYFRYNKRVKN